MAKTAKGSQPPHSVLAGDLHKDHWVGGDTTLRIAPAAEARTIRLTVWNPWYSRAYLNNLVKVAFNGRSVFSEKLQPAGTVVIEHGLAAHKPLDVEITSEARLEPDPLDGRERGVIVRLTQERLKA